MAFTHVNVSRTTTLPLVFVGLALIAAACTPGTSAPEETDTTSTAPTTTEATTTTEYTGESFAGTVDAPEFPDGLEWINTAEPVTLNSLKGKVVVLDFWTYGCVNCIHILPDLERLEAEYADELVVIGVHSAKFTNEAETGNLRDIVQRYGIEHPVVNDKDFEVWGSWGANAWPTVAVIDPSSRVVGIRAGEGVYEAVEPVVAGLVAEFDAQGAIDRRPIEFALEADTAPDRPLSYPGKVLAAEGRLFVSDTGHHRILEIDPDTGDVLAAYGDGTRGDRDGVALEASFNSPQGIALDGDTLYVADTNNHLIRAIDLASGEVATVVGTGEQGWPPSTGPLLSTAISTPWDIDLRSGVLYFANAGTHQIWTADPDLDETGPLIGSAIEGTINGAFVEAQLAQPSSVTISDDGRLFFADSESSSIRVGDLEREETALVVGGDANLFEFGDVDGIWNMARLQHPLGTAVDGDTLYVADTYNSKLKRVDLVNSEITTWLGDEAGWADGSDPRFNEPGGLSLGDGVLYVADTNNHAIRVVDLETGVTSTLVLKGVERFDPPSEFRGDVIDLGSVTVSTGSGDLVLDYALPAGYKVNADAPSSITIAGGSAAFEAGDTVDITGTDLPATIPISYQRDSTTARFDVTVIYCEAVNPNLCLIDRTRFEVELVAGSGAGDLTLSKTIPDPVG